MTDPRSPILLPPRGGDQNRAWQLHTADGTVFSTVTILVCARIYTRTFIVKNVGVDDYLIILGAVSRKTRFHAYVE